MFSVRLRPVIQDESCAVNGCRFAASGFHLRNQDAAVVVEVNGTVLLEMCVLCAAELAHALTVEARVCMTARFE